MKKFFGIEKDVYEFEIMDMFTLFTIVNVVLVLLGVWFAPVFGLVNCALAIINNIRIKGVHINSYIMQIALFILNCYFLIL